MKPKSIIILSAVGVICIAIFIGVSFLKPINESPEEKQNNNSTKTDLSLNEKIPSPENLSANYSNLYRITGVSELWNKGYTGLGIKIAVIDSGIDENHPDLKGKIIKEKDFVVAPEFVYEGTIEENDVDTYNLSLIEAANFSVKIYCPDCCNDDYPNSLELKITSADNNTFCFTDKPACGQEYQYECGINETINDNLTIEIKGKSISREYESVDYLMEIYFESSYDYYGHGTYSAGISSGTGKLSNGTYKGTAPDALLLNARAFTNRDNVRKSYVIEAVKWAIENDADIINLNIGFEPLTNCKDDPLSGILKTAINKGIIVVAAGGDEKSFGSITSPGCLGEVITVGTAYVDGFVVPFGSSRGPTAEGCIKPDIVAPGFDIPSAMSGGGYFGGVGTSASTSYVSGAIALLLQAYKETHNGKKPEQKMVKSALMNSAWEPKKYCPHENGAGFINISQAYNLMNNCQMVIPGSLEFGYVYPGETITKTITIINNKNSTVNVTLGRETFDCNVNKYPGGNITRWMKLPSTVSILPDENKTLPVNITLPFNQNAGTYLGRILIESSGECLNGYLPVSVVVPQKISKTERQSDVYPVLNGEINEKDNIFYTINVSSDIERLNVTLDWSDSGNFPSVLLCSKDKCISSNFDKPQNLLLENPEEGIYAAWIRSNVKDKYQLKFSTGRSDINVTNFKVIDEITGMRDIAKSNDASFSIKVINYNKFNVTGSCGADVEFKEHYGYDYITSWIWSGNVIAEKSAVMRNTIETSKLDAGTYLAILTCDFMDENDTNIGNVIKTLYFEVV